MTRLAHAPALIPMSDEAFACHSAVGTGAFTVVHEAQTAKRFMLTLSLQRRCRTTPGGDFIDGRSG